MKTMKKKRVHRRLSRGREGCEFFRGPVDLLLYPVPIIVPSLQGSPSIGETFHALSQD